MDCEWGGKNLVYDSCAVCTVCIDPKSKKYSKEKFATMLLVIWPDLKNPLYNIWHEF